MGLVGGLGKRVGCAFIDTVGDGYVELAVGLGVDLDKINTCIDFAAAEKYKVKSAGSAAGSTKILQELIGLIADGKLDIPIAKSYSLIRYKRLMPISRTNMM